MIAKTFFIGKVVTAQVAVAFLGKKLDISLIVTTRKRAGARPVERRIILITDGVDVRGGERKVVQDTVAESSRSGQVRRAGIGGLADRLGYRVPLDGGVFSIGDKISIGIPDGRSGVPLKGLAPGIA